MFKPKNPIKQGLSIIIVGCGKVGVTLIEQLSQEGHDITIIDKDASKVSEYGSLYDVMGVVGNGASYSVQMEAGIESADLLIAVTDSDELNLLCCTIAKRVGNCAAIARVRTPDYSNETAYLADRLDLAMIVNPEAEAAKEAARILSLPTVLDVSSFAKGEAVLVKFKVPEGNMMDGMAVSSLGQNVAKNILICAIARNDNVYIPSGDFRVRSGDVMSFVSSSVEARRFLNAIGFATNQVKNTMIIGGGDAAFYMAKELLKIGVNVKIIEQDLKRCEELSILLPKAVIINGDGTDADVLREEGLAYAESFVPLTGIDEENVLLTLHAKKESNAKVITKINRNTFKEVIDSLDLGSVLYPRYITAEAIVAYVRGKQNSIGEQNIATLYHMYDQRVEAIEFQIVANDPKLLNIPLMDLKLKKDLLISFINRHGKIIIPSGQDCIKFGDTVMIVTTHKGFKNITDILA